jgi:hypothetical protein
MKTSKTFVAAFSTVIVAVPATGVAEREPI